MLSSDTCAPCKSLHTSPEILANISIHSPQGGAGRILPLPFPLSYEETGVSPSHALRWKGKLKLKLGKREKEGEKNTFCSVLQCLKYLFGVIPSEQAAYCAHTLQHMFHKLFAASLFLQQPHSVSLPVLTLILNLHPGCKSSLVQNPQSWHKVKKLFGRADCGHWVTFRWFVLVCGFSVSKLQSKRALGIVAFLTGLGGWLQRKPLPQTPLSAGEEVSFLDLAVSSAGLLLAEVILWSLSWVSE